MYSSYCISRLQANSRPEPIESGPSRSGMELGHHDRADRAHRDRSRARPRRRHRVLPLQERHVRHRMSASLQ